MLRGRESLIPEVPRTLHIGQKGLNVNPGMQDRYFARMHYNTERNVRYEGKVQKIFINRSSLKTFFFLGIANLTKSAYDEMVRSRIAKALKVFIKNGSEVKPCGKEFLRGVGQGRTRDRVRV